jgi:hypothetical protein
MMIDATNYSAFKTELQGVPLFERDVPNVVYGADLGTPIMTTEPAPGDVPYLKAPEADLWLKLIPR